MTRRATSTLSTPTARAGGGLGTRRVRARAHPPLSARAARLVARSWCRADRGPSLCADATVSEVPREARGGGGSRARGSRGPRLAPPPSTHHQASGRPLGFGSSVRCLVAHRALATDILMERPKHARPKGATGRVRPTERGSTRARALPSGILALHTAVIALSSFRAPRRSASADAGRAGGRRACRRADATRGGEQGAVARANE